MPRDLTRVIRITEPRQQFLVKEDYLPTRCEICHQTDYFNPATNYCIRCRNIAERIRIPERVLEYTFGHGLFEGFIVGVLITLLIVGIISLIGPDPDPDPRQFEGIIYLLVFNVVSGLVTGCASSQYLKLTADRNVLLPGKIIVEWLTCIFLGIIANSSLWTTIFLIYGIFINQSLKINYLIMGILLGGFFGVINCGMNSSILIWKRNRELRAFLNG